MKTCNSYKIRSKNFIFALFFLFFDRTRADNKLPELVVYTTTSFAQGIGKSAKENFEKENKCIITYRTFSELEHSMMYGKTLTRGEGVVGVSHELILSKEKTLQLFEKLDLHSYQPLPQGWNDPLFVPVFFSLLGFVYNTNHVATVPKSFEDLLSFKGRIILTDPRTSSPGFGLMLWIKKIYGDKAAEYWKKLSSKILTIPSSWSESYMMFLNGEAPITLGYHTSPAYHRIVERKNNFSAINFKEGNYVQYSVAGIFKSARFKHLFQKFINYILSESIQTAVVFEDWSYPVRKITKPLPTEFREISPSDAPINYKEIQNHKKEWLNEWKAALVG